MYYKINEEEYPILSEEEEKRLLVLYKYSSDEKERKSAEEKLIGSNLKIILKQSLAYGRKCHVEPEVLVSYGVEGLQMALKRYKLEKNFRLLTYALPWINKKIIYGCHKESGPVQFPDYVWEELQVFKKKWQELAGVLGREPSYRPCSAECGKRYISELEEVLVYSDNAPFTATRYQTVVEAFEIQGNVLSLDAEVCIEDNNGGKLLDIVEDKNLEKRNAAENLRRALEEELDKMRVKYDDGEDISCVIKKYFFEGKTIGCICEETGKNKTQVDSLKKKGMMLLRSSPVLCSYISNN